MRNAVRKKRYSVYLDSSCVIVMPDLLLGLEELLLEDLVLLGPDLLALLLVLPHLQRGRALEAIV